MTKTYKADFKADLKTKKGTGLVSAVVSAYNVAYQMADDVDHMMLPGALAAAEGPIPVFWGHSWAEHAGLPIGWSRTEETADGLLAHAQFNINTEGGRSVFDAIKAGAIREWSIGYKIEDYEETQGANGRRLWKIKRAELLENSAVLRGANPNTQTMSVAAAERQRKEGVMPSRKKKTVAEIARQAGLNAADPGAELARIKAEDKRRHDLEEAWKAMPHTAGAVDPRVVLARQIEANNAGVETFNYTTPESVASLVVGDAYRAAGQTHPSHADPGFAVPQTPLPSGVDRFVSLYELVTPAEGNLKEPLQTDADDVADFAEEGDPLPERNVTFAPSRNRTMPFGALVHADISVFVASGTAEADTLETLYSDFRRRLALRMALGSGDTPVPAGLVTDVATDANNTSSAAGGDPVSFIADAAATVGNHGYDGALTVVGHPGTLYELVEGRPERNVRHELPYIADWIPLRHLPPGMVIVGDFLGAGARLFVKDMALHSSLSHTDHFRKRKITLRLSAGVTYSIARPDALWVLTDVGAS